MPNLLPRRRRPRYRLVRWPRAGLLQFPLGLDTLHPVGQVPLGALRVATNEEFDQRGASRRRKGRTAYGTALDGPSLGDYELIRRDGTKYLLRIYNGRLYASSDDAATWTQVPIRLYKPYPAYPDDNNNGEKLNGVDLHAAKEKSSGAVGANLVAERTYQWACLAVYGAGKTTLSSSAQLTLDASPNPVDLNFHGVYKAQTYEIWRRESADGGATWGSWGRLVTGLSHTTTGGKTLVQHTDDGNTVPDTGVSPPNSNTTEHTLPTSTKVDWETDLWSGDHAAYFVAGDGICRTDGTQAEIVAPTDPSTYLESAAGINALGDVTWAGHKATCIRRHHAYLFYAGSADAHQAIYWSRADDPGHVPQLGTTTVPQAAGGRTLDFAVKDDHLVIGLTTGLWVLFGRIFNPTGPDSSVYLKQISDQGVASARSMAKAPNGWVIYLAANDTIRAVVTTAGTTDQLATIELAPSIQPTIEGMTDQANACATFHDGQYWLAFPADAKAIRLFFFESEAAQQQGVSSEQPVRIVPVQDTARPFRNFLLRQDGTLLAADDTTGKLWKLNDGYTDDGNTITGTIRTPPLDLGDPWLVKHLAYIVLVVQQPTSASTLNIVVAGDRMTQPVETSLAASGEGYDLSTYDVSVYDPFNLVVKQVDVDDESRIYEVEITDSGTGEPVTILGLVFYSAYVEELA